MSKSSPPLFADQLGLLFMNPTLQPVRGYEKVLFQVEAMQSMYVIVTQSAFDQVNSSNYAHHDYLKLMNMIKAYMYRHRYCNSPQLVICDDSEYQSITSLIQPNSKVVLRSVQLLSRESKSLSSRQIKIETLWNAMNTPGKKLILPRNCKFDDNKIKVSISQFGQVYGCDAETSSAVLTHFLQTGLMHRESDMILRLTFDGMCAYEDYYANQETKEIFVVQPFELPRNDRFDFILAECRRLTGLVIEPVWAKEHNEKIDERILRKIDRCGAVLVYVDNSRFNVGFECGYALARGKQIICIKPRLPRRPAKSLSARFSQPFDISTLNTTEYDETDWEVAAKRVAARLSLAVGEEIPADKEDDVN